MLGKRSVRTGLPSWMLFLGVAWFSAAGVSAEDSSVPRPNILWLTAEDMSPTLGCYGDAYAVTPNLDRLAEESVRYTNVFATAPVCSPCRSCLITGCYATTMGTAGLRSSHPIPEWIHGFPSYLREAGYYCTNNAKTDYNTSRAGAIIRESWNACGNQAHWRGRGGQQPFFSVFNHMVSHQSRTMVWPYEKFVAEVQSRLAPEKIHDPSEAPVPPYYPDTPVVRRTVARYYDCVSVMDQQVGALLEALERDGLADETIVFFYSDHGSGLPRHKRILLDSGLQVPLLVRFPEKYRHLAPAAPGETCDRLISFVDFPPTMLSLLELPIPAYMQGVPFLGEAAGPPRKAIYGARDRVDEAYDRARCVRTKRYLYLRNFRPDRSWNQPSFYSDQGEIRREINRLTAARELEGPAWDYAGPTRPREALFDVEADPMQLENLLDEEGKPRKEEHREVLREMQGRLFRMIMETRDVGFLSEPEMMRRAEAMPEGERTPYEMAKQSRRYSPSRVFAVASTIGETEMIFRQRTWLDDEDPGVRYQAVLGLRAALTMDLADAEQREAIVAAMRPVREDPVPEIAIVACDVGVRAEGDRQALDRLVGLLEHPNGEVAVFAARTLELLGEKARPVEEAIAEYLVKLEEGARGGDPAMFMHFALDPLMKQLERQKE